MLYERFIKADTSSYEAFHKTFKITALEDFNYGFDVLDELSKTCPNSLALLYTNPAGEEKRFTFEQMSKNSNRAANYFKGLGIKKGDRVMLIMKRNYQYWFASMGICKLGAVVIPATVQLSASDITYRCNAAGVKMIICANDADTIYAVENAMPNSPTVMFTALVGPERKGWLDFDRGLSSMSDSFPRPEADERMLATDPMLIYFTSGTTGHPKMALHNFLYPLGHIVTARFWHTNEPGGLHFTISDTGWAKAAWGKLYGQWLCESSVFVYDFDRFNAKEVLSKLEQYNITTFCAPPTMYRMITQEPVHAYDLSALKHCCSAGEPLTPEVFSDWKRMTGHEIHEGFGQSETTCCLGTLPGMPIKLGSMGRPLPGYDIILADKKGRRCRPGEIGEICVCVDQGAPTGLFLEYFRDEELTKKVWCDGLYHTGDTALIDEDGYFWYVGRADDIIKSSGYRIGPFEVESVLLEHPAVLEAAVTGAPDPVRGQVVQATIVLKPGYEGSDLLKRELQNHVKSLTAPYKYPRIIYFVDALPKTVSGKIKRAEIRRAN
ncbi:AMP-binding protein [Eubacteriales bacterium OttesenSCG-928-K08]|nr:AMP-binding protein [Eubacteriales bacterium OttesenSCG-928-K08]